MSFKRLSQPTGQLSAGEKREGDSKLEVKRDAILVHSGPNGTAMVFDSADGKIKFDKARIQKIVENQNKLRDLLIAEYGGEDKIPDGAYPPMLDQHNDDSNNRIIGRLTGKLRFEVRDVPKVGKNVACAIAETTWKGEETVQKVNDGRIYHLSIGIDEATDTLGETSAVIEPAAPGAMLLNKGKNPNSKGVTNMAKANKKRLAAHNKRLKSLSAVQGTLTEMSKKLVGASENVRLAKRQSEVGGKLTKLMKAGKMTPAEYKKLEIKKLAALDDTSLETMISTFEAREPQVLAGQRGSSDAANFADMGADLEKRQFKRLKAEARADLKRLGAKLNKDEETDKALSGPKEEEINPGKDPHAVAGEEHQLKKMMHEMKKHLEEGDMAKCKAVHAEMEKHMASSKHLADGGGMSDVKSEDEEKAFGHMQSQVDELNTQLARMAGMVSELMDAEKEEGHELEADGDGEGDEGGDPKHKEEKKPGEA